MQFNFVVSTNTRAIRLWERFGFTVVGRLPEAFAFGARLRQRARDAPRSV